GSWCALLDLNGACDKPPAPILFNRKLESALAHTFLRMHRATRQPGASSMGPSEPDVVPALQTEDLARVVGSCDFEPEPFDDLPRGAHLRGIRFGQRAGSEPQAVLETDADMPAHRGRLRRHRQLIAPCAEHAPVVPVAEQAIGRALH